MGIDLYDERFCTIVFSPAAEAAGYHGNKGPMAWRDFLKQRRFAGKPFVERIAKTRTDGDQGKDGHGCGGRQRK